MIAEPLTRTERRRVRLRHILQAIAMPGDPLPQRRHRDPRGWSNAELDLLAWYRDHRGEIPPEPFPLGAGRTVTSRQAFVAGLDRDVERGPNGPRAAGLIHDLTLLRRLVERGRKAR